MYQKELVFFIFISVFFLITNQSLFISSHYRVNKAGERYDKLRERIHDTKARDNSHDSVNISNIVMGCMESAEILHRTFYSELK